MNFALVAHCDWGVSEAKRWMAFAHRENDRWIIRGLQPVGKSSDLISRLQQVAGPERPILIGFDFPIGLPEWYARKTGLASFRDALAAFGTPDWHEWFTVASHRSEISLRRPFYPMRPGGTSRGHLLDALGAAEFKLLLRRCEQSTSDRQAACSLFWTLGGNQVGKGAIAGWKEVIVPNLDKAGLWPFGGTLPSLATRFPVALAETYPGDVYAHLGIDRGGWSKRRQLDRQRVARSIAEWLQSRQWIDATTLHYHLQDGFGADKAGEDRFDAVVGLLGMLSVVNGERPEGTPDDPAVHAVEGWILGHVR